MKMLRCSAALLCSLLSSLNSSAGIVINEIHYDAEPKTEFVEFIELKNTGETPLDLSGWTFADGVSLTIPTGTFLAPGSFLLLAEDPAALTAQFSQIPPETQVLEYSGSLSNDGEKLELLDATGALMDSVDYRVGFPWPVSPGGEGDSMQLVQTGLDNDLGGAWRGAPPTPSQDNSVVVANAPPLIRQVTHTPHAPNSQEHTTVTAKITDSDGVNQVQLLVQIVTPGAYLPAYLPRDYSTLTGAPTSPLQDNPEFEAAANWTSLPMVDDGSQGDAIAGDSIYTCQVPAQAHRTLVRYRITAVDTLAGQIRVPYADDGSRNFAYFVYDGLPAYTASSNSVHPEGAGHTYSADILNTLPVYTMITRDADRRYAYAYSSTGDGGLQIPKNNVAATKAFNWECTLVYDGVVYDHVLWRLRQRNDRYTGNGKRSMRFRFNRGHYFQARDENGNLLKEKWRSLNTGKMARFSGTNTYGIPETINSKLWRMVGVECPRFFPVHFRMIDDAEEAPDQYNGDFFGLATVIQDIDGRLLDERDLPNGNIYKLKDGVSNPLDLQRNQSRQGVTDGSDFTNIRNNLNASRSDSWLESHVDWDQWMRYHAVVEAVRHYDFGTTASHLKNRTWYFKPDSASIHGLLRLIPHDHDATWIKGYHDQYNATGIAIGIGFPWASIFNDTTRPPSSQEKETFTIAYRNFIREFRDLLWQKETVNRMIDEHANAIEAFCLADRDRWDGAPAEAGSESMVNLSDITDPMKDVAFASDTVYGSELAGGRAAFLDQIASDEQIPDTPSISYTGEADYPTDSLQFNCSAFSDSQGANTFGKMQWRVAEVANLDTNAQGSSKLITSGDTWKYHDIGGDPGTGWTESSFDDSTWAEGQTQIGYGESDQKTTVSGPSRAATFFRTTLNITDAESLSHIDAAIIRDDGAVVYVNGAEVWRNQMPDGPINHLTLASAAASGSDESVAHPFSIPPSAFVEGLNTIAVSIHQHDPGSGDMSFDFELTAHWQPSFLPATFEWNHPWESGEITTFQNSLSLPAVATRPGHTYRARVRHADQSGRWSHWSAPIEFTTTASNLSRFKESLVISEIMYHPPPPTSSERAAGFIDADDFEFVEIRNVSDQSINLTELRFTKGVDFDFAGSGITSLAPGEYVLLVEDAGAFSYRYGNNSRVAGQWSGKLDNGGERLKLSFGAGEAIHDFTYDDVSPWPTPPDGEGASLVLIDPIGLPDHSDAFNWRSSTAIAGTPGYTDGSTYDNQYHGSLLTYAVRAQKNHILPNGNTALVLERNYAAEDLVGSIEQSSNLIDWEAVDDRFSPIQITPTSDGYAEMIFESDSPLHGERMFLRYHVQLR
ncbi:lamin tail domain-containing protein [Verrucomicrobiaceae bacterium N1E253]|uniref:Lamin tail domain-containing protein n=1 Tax=Oceaniferula marina TaxID=2748318 RepID=A0A851GJF6_9BACT|nr:lamin tail domain-containing protein [Oceaniferula marina]NWK55237.1 lamin tail domain-containing protein [Oceaniferula marina]